MIMESGLLNLLLGWRFLPRHLPLSSPEKFNKKPGYTM